MKVKDLLTDEKKWIKKYQAVDNFGKDVSIFDTRACKWCLYGAVIKCYGAGDRGFINVYKVLFKIRREIGCAITTWNDSTERKFDDIKRLVEKLDI